MEDAFVFGDLHIERKSVFETVFPIDFEAEEIDVELAGLGFVEDAEHGRDFAEGHGTKYLADWWEVVAARPPLDALATLILASVVGEGIYLFKMAGRWLTCFGRAA